MRIAASPMRYALPCVAAAVLYACGDAAPQVDAGGRLAEFVLDNDLISESSGLARSHRDPAMLWTHNDSGGNAEAYALDSSGHFLGTLTIGPAINIDWEDMTSFVENGTPRLLLADIGDNYAARPALNLYIVDEPDLAGAEQPFTLNATVVRAIEVSYPDGPRDAEAIAVDATEGAIYLLSKRDAVPRLYRVPLNPAAPALVAEAMGEINIPRQDAATAGADSFNHVTSMDIAADTGALVLTTYTHAYVYARTLEQSWQQALQQAPQSFDLPAYSQIEAVSFDIDAQSVWITSENLPAPLTNIPLPAP